jgi:hypothetical protein
MYQHKVEIVHMPIQHNSPNIASNNVVSLMVWNWMEADS